MFERVEPRRAGVEFLEGSDFAFDDGSALEDAFFNTLAEGCGGGEESLLGTRNHDLLLDAALGAAAQDQVARGVLRTGDFFHLHALFLGASGKDFEGLFFKRVGILGAAAARDVDDVGIALLLEQGEVRVRGESRVEDNHGLETILIAGEPIENEQQGLCVGHVAFKGLVGERESVFVKGDANGDGCDWQMNYHIEHNMYAAVPCNNLGKLHKMILHDLPPTPRGLVGVWREINAILKKQEADPTYQHEARLQIQASGLPSATT
jgi:hypothetical protein